MRRRDFITLVVGAIVTWPFAAMAQEAGRTYRDGLISPNSVRNHCDYYVNDERRRRGFIKGQNLAIDCRDFGA